MQNIRKIFVALTILVIIGLFVVGGVYVYVYKQDGIDHKLNQNQDWKTYTNDQYNFSIQYPAYAKIYDVSINSGREISFDLTSGRKLKIDIVTQEYRNGVLESANCSNFDLNVKISHITINGIDFVAGDVTSRFVSAAVKSNATEYCTVKGRTAYSITPVISWNPYSNNSNNSIKVDNDSVLNQMVSSFKFLPLSDGIFIHSVSTVLEMPDGLYRSTLIGYGFNNSSRVFLYDNGINQTEKGIIPQSISSDGNQLIFVLPWWVDRTSYVVKVSNGTVMSDGVQLILPPAGG